MQWMSSLKLKKLHNFTVATSYFSLSDEKVRLGMEPSDLFFYYILYTALAPNICMQHT